VLLLTGDPFPEGVNIPADIDTAMVSDWLLNGVEAPPTESH
jgi:hypothetical protein